MPYEIILAQEIPAGFRQGWEFTATVALTAALVLGIVSVIGRLLGLAVPALAARRACGGRGPTWMSLLAWIAVWLLASLTATGVACATLGWAPREPRWLDWAALIATACAAVLGLPDRSARFSAAAVYLLAATAIGLGHLQGFPPGRYFVWASACEWSGFVLVAALIGWVQQKWQSVVATRSGSAELPDPPSLWFLRTQLLLVGAGAALAGWVAFDFDCDGLGEGVALFGWTGRGAGVPAALMLLGAAILMAWQSSGVWRARWQYAALAAGVLFSSSWGWSRVDAAGAAPWLDRTTPLLLSTSMMTLLTSFGLARVLPGKTDWIPRARAAPIFGGLSILLLALVLLQEWLRRV